MTRWLIAVLILLHGPATLVLMLRARRQYRPFEHMMTRRLRFALRWGWALVAYDIALATLVFGRF